MLACARVGGSIFGLVWGMCALEARERVHGLLKADARPAGDEAPFSDRRARVSD